MPKTQVILSNRAKAYIKAAWNLACKEDGIDPAAKFVVFSDTNKYARLYNRLMAHYLGGN